MGSPAYMAPEQVVGKDATTVSDVYSLGVVLYEMVTGKLPFVDETAMLTALKRLHEEPREPRALVRELDPRWNRTIMRCLERDPRDRFATVDEVWAALNASPPSARLLGWRALMVAFVVVGIAGMSTVAWNARRGKIAPPPPIAPVVMKPVTPSPAANELDIDLRAEPASAQLWLDSREISNPFAATIEDDGAPHVVTAKAHGYKMQSHTLRFAEERALTLTLEREPHKAKSPFDDFVQTYPK